MYTDIYSLYRLCILPHGYHPRWWIVNIYGHVNDKYKFEKNPLPGSVNTDVTLFCILIQVNVLYIAIQKKKRKLSLDIVA